MVVKKPAAPTVTGLAVAEQAGRLTVPLEHLGAARRVLRDRIAAHQIHFTPGPLDLGGHDERQDV